MKLRELDLPGVKLVYLEALPDSRGVFVETYNQETFAELGFETDFVQDSWSLSVRRHTVRGLHFQSPPRAQAKLVRVSRGRAWDVVVDLRQGSPTFGHHEVVEMRDDEWVALFVPIGMAHGFCTLEDNTEIVYKMSDHYSPEHYMGLLWNDPALGIEWPMAESSAIISDRDRAHPRLAELPPHFEWPSHG